MGRVLLPAKRFATPQPVAYTKLMRIFLLAALLLLALDGPVMASEERPGKWGWVNRVLHPFGGPKGEADRDKNQDPRLKNLTLSMIVEPGTVDLSETRQLKIALSLTNKSRRAVQLQFPTTQRIEILIKDERGKLVTQWSEDQAFENQPAFVMINPGERIEYNATLGTRDLVADRSYVVEGFFPNFDAFKASKTLTPVK